MTQAIQHPRASDFVRIRDVQITRLGLGTATQGGLFEAVSENDARDVFQVAWDAGLRYFDTAPWYGFGSSEQRLGAFLHDQTGFAVSSKVGRLLGADFPAHPSQFQADGTPCFATPSRLNVKYDFSYDGAMRSLEDSLERTGLTHIDIALVHDPDQHGAGVHEVLTGCGRALLEMRDQGVIGAVGAGMNQWQMPLELARAADFDVFLLAGRYTLLEQDSLPFMEYCALHRVKVIVGSVFNTGLLVNPNANAIYNYAPVPADVLARALMLEAVCARYGVPLRAAALQFVLRHPAVASVLVAARTAAQLEDNLEMFARPIPDALWEELRVLETVRPAGIRGRT